MIQALWIITETGQCIFSHKYNEELTIDDQLISGLLTAFDAFSKESGIGGVQQIAGEDNQFVYGSSGKLFVAALADKRDNAELVEKLMVKISDLFQEKYKQYLAEISFVDLNVFNGFEEEIDNILFKKIYKRGVGSTIFGVIVSLALTAGIFLLLYDYLNVAIFLVFLIFVPGLFIGSLIAGKSLYGLIASTISVLPIMGYYAFSIVTNGLAAGDSIPSMVSNVFLMAVTYVTIAMLCGILGGGAIDRRRLFPLEKPKKYIEVFPSDVQVALPDVGQSVAYPEQPALPDDLYQQQPQTDFYAESSSFIQEPQSNNNEWEQ